ncbi:MAG: hypothetical protein VZS44_11870 [Bacilli bacterium]|nr:hypothetical protein [Bacilli bacterium]
MISFKVFNSVDEINAWCYTQPSIDIINIETLVSNKTFKFRMWYKQ